MGSGTLTITNVTLSGNTAGDAGAAIYNSINGATLKAVNSTIADNVDLGGPGTGAGIDSAANDGTTLKNTIVVLNTDGTGAARSQPTSRAAHWRRRAPITWSASTRRAVL